PWPVIRSMVEFVVNRTRGRLSEYGLDEPDHRLLEHAPPAVSSTFLPLVRDGRIRVKPQVRRLAGEEVEFVDGTVQSVDAIICATGYVISFPFLSEQLISPHGNQLPLYRRILHPERDGLAFIGLVDPNAGLLPVLEAQSEWLGDLLEDKITLPSRDEMWAATERAEPRTIRRFGA